MSILGKSDIFGASDLEFENVDVPEWGGTVRVRGLTGAERDAFEDSRMQKTGRTREVSLINFRASLLVKCIVDENGDRVFADSDAGELGKRSGRVLDRLYDVAARLSGLSDSDVDELEKNSVGALNGAHGSG